MSDEIKKFAYCPNCSKNVPHCRNVKGQYPKSFDWVLQVLRIGPWYCLHCQRKRLVLPLVRGDAQDYRIVQPSDPVDPDKPAIWSLSCSGDGEEEYDEGSDWAADESDFNSVQEGENSVEPVFGTVAQQPANGIAREGDAEGKFGFSEMVTSHQHTSSVYVVDQFDLEESNSVTGEPLGADYINGDEQSFHRDDDTEKIPVEVLGQANGAGSSVLESRLGTAEAGETVDMNAEPPQTNGHEAVEVIEAEPVGNFIRDRSLALKVTRIYRFTEKYRDSVVERILAGKIKISTLTSDGMYTEAELVSWIADKTKRQNKKIETLELDTDPRWSDQRRKGSHGPFG